MYAAAIPIFLYLFSGSTAQSTWEYNCLAKTTDGKPCISNCNNNQCIADWYGNTKDCRSSNDPAPKFHTANLEDKKSQYCLSNCGYFGYPYQWCVTTNEKGWDYCNAEQYDVSVYKKRCRSACVKGSADYYWCFVDAGKKNWQYCAPAVETDEEIDIRHADDVTIF